MFLELWVFTPTTTATTRQEQAESNALQLVHPYLERLLEGALYLAARIGWSLPNGAVLAPVAIICAHTKEVGTIKNYFVQK